MLSLRTRVLLALSFLTPGMIFLWRMDTIWFAAPVELQDAAGNWMVQLVWATPGLLVYGLTDLGLLAFVCALASFKWMYAGLDLPRFVGRA